MSPRAAAPPGSACDRTGTARASRRPRRTIRRRDARAGRRSVPARPLPPRVLDPEAPRRGSAHASPAPRPAPPDRSRAGSTARTRGSTRPRRPSSPGAPAAAPCPGRRRPHRPVPRTRRGVRPRRPACSRVRPVARRGSRAADRGRRPAASPASSRASGSCPASRRARAPRARRSPWLVAPLRWRRPCERPPRGRARCPRREALPRPAAARPVRLRGTLRGRRRARRPRGVRGPLRAQVHRVQMPRRRRRSPRPHRLGPRSVVLARAGAARTARTAPARRACRRDPPITPLWPRGRTRGETLVQVEGRTPRTGLAAMRQASGAAVYRGWPVWRERAQTTRRRPAMCACTSVRAEAPSCTIASGDLTESHRPNSSSGIGREM